MEGCRPLPNTQHSSVGATETLSLCDLGASLLRAQLSHSPVQLSHLNAFIKWFHQTLLCITFFIPWNLQKNVCHFLENQMTF